jgi:hypothetical protein
MKYKKFKYKSYNRKPVNKKALIIWISVAVAVLLIAAVAAVLIISNTNSGGSTGNGGNTGNIIDNIFGNDNKEEDNTIKEIKVTRYPDKVSYYCGEWFDKTGLTVYQLTNGGAFTKVDIDKCTVTGFDSSAPTEQQILTVTYEGFTATFPVTIKEAPKPVPSLVSVVLETMPKTEYKVGENLNTEGGVMLCTYSDGTTQKIDLKPKHVSGFVAAMESGVAGEYELEVKYSENGVRVKTTYKITISE